jgi:hypothetical protein
MSTEDARALLDRRLGIAEKSIKRLMATRERLLVLREGGGAKGRKHFDTMLRLNGDLLRIVTRSEDSVRRRLSALDSKTAAPE